MGLRPCDICGGRHKTKRTTRGGRQVTISEADMRRRCLLGTKGFKSQLKLALYAALNARDGGRCQRCGRFGWVPATLDPSHVFRQSQYGRMRFDLANVLSMCAKCHHWWHYHEMDAVRWFSETWPDRMEWLDVRAVECRVLSGTIPTQWYEDQLHELRSFTEEAKC